MVRKYLCVLAEAVVGLFISLVSCVDDTFQRESEEIFVFSDFCAAFYTRQMGMRYLNNKNKQILILIYINRIDFSIKHEL